MPFYIGSNYLWCIDEVFDNFLLYLIDLFFLYKLVFGLLFIYNYLHQHRE